MIDGTLPDAHAGLKPVCRRLLYAMNGKGLLSNRPYRKAVQAGGRRAAAPHHAAGCR